MFEYIYRFILDYNLLCHSIFLTLKLVINNTKTHFNFFNLTSNCFCCYCNVYIIELLNIIVLISRVVTSIQVCFHYFSKCKRKARIFIEIYKLKVETMDTRDHWLYALSCFTVLLVECFNNFPNILRRSNKSAWKQSKFEIRLINFFDFIVLYCKTLYFIFAFYIFIFYLCCKNQVTTSDSQGVICFPFLTNRNIYTYTQKQTTNMINIFNDK